MTTAPERYLKMMSSRDDDWSGEWMDAIGWIGYYFGQLEYASVWLVDAIGSKTQQRRFANKTFAERCELASDRLVPRIADSAVRVEWAEFLLKARACAHMRNDILHNPIELNVEEINRHGIKIDQGIRLLRNKAKRVITIGEVQAYTKELIELHTTMIGLMARTARRP